MRKFKVKKNYKKRAYHKKIQAHSFSLTRPVLIGLIPSFIIAIGLLTSVIINTHALDFYDNFQYNFTPPSISLPHYSFSIPHVSFPTVTIWIPDISLPDINFAPSLKSFSTTFESIASATALGILNFISLLNPLPFLQNFSFTAGRIFISNLYATLSFYLGVSAVLYQFTQTVLYVLEVIFGIVESFFISVITLIVHFFVVCIQTMLSIITFIWTGFASLLYKIWKLILIPFIAIKNVCLFVSPYIKATVRILGKSAADLLQNVQGISSFVMTLSKSTAH